jgi:hypothetical protein
MKSYRERIWSDPRSLRTLGMGRARVCYLERTDAATKAYECVILLYSNKYFFR